MHECKCAVTKNMNRELLDLVHLIKEKYEQKINSNIGISMNEDLIYKKIDRILKKYNVEGK
jgi:thiamine biosynthesis protein ThiC